MMFSDMLMKILNLKNQISQEITDYMIHITINNHLKNNCKYFLLRKKF